MKTIGICGHFAFGQQETNGQTVKTVNLYEALQSQFDVVSIDTYNWKKPPVRLLSRLIAAERRCDAIIMLPAHNGVRVFSRLFVVLNGIFRKRLFYDVIGGWLPELTKRYSHMAKCLKRFDGIWVETAGMKKALLQQGFSNVVVLPNFKDLRIVQPQELVYPSQKPYRLCTFSRVMLEKGLEDAIAAVKAVNEVQGEAVFELDIYGPVDEGYRERFDYLRACFPTYIRYKGTVPAAESVETIRPYFALLFPTRFYTEGIPGTIIDAYAAGVPVIATRWENYRDCIEEDITGFCYDFGSAQGLQSVLLDLLREPERAMTKKVDCLRAAERYTKDAFLGDVSILLEKCQK